MLLVLLPVPGATARSPSSHPIKPGFLAGAAVEVTSPPLSGTAAAAQADRQFGASRVTCPGAAYPTEGRFALQDPFNDVNGNRQWDEQVDLNGGPPGGVPEPFCDPNGNGRWDGLYADNGKGPLTGVHDNTDVRAVAISDGHDRPVVYASVDQIGLFDYYTEQARALLAGTYRVNADLVVSADHNESSPDSIGLYGPFQTPLGVGSRSGIDEYYMRFLEDRIAHAAADAVHRLRPARLYANQVQGAVPTGASGSQYPLLKGMSQRISDQFPTSVALPRDDRVAAVDTKLGVLQARRPDGRPIFTVISLAAHNQEMGNSGSGISADWPGALEHAFDSAHAGVAVFLVGDNGSEEDPQTSPTVIPKGSENHSNQATQYRQAQATGARFAQVATVAARGAQPLAPGIVRLTRRQLCVPLENNGFVGLAATGEFGRRQGYLCDRQGNPIAPVPNGSIIPTASNYFRTFVSYTDIGPDLQLLDNPGESFPALMLGSPFGVEDVSCNRPNPAVPTWHARALFRFQVGLADDLIGYLIPAWGFASGTPGLFSNDSCFNDMHGHKHKLESESVGPTGANDVANRLAALLEAEPDRSAHVVRARFVLADGSYSRWPTHAVGILLPPAGRGTLDSGGGTLIGGPSTAGVGSRAVDSTGFFMDYDGQPQATPDVTTRGMMTLGQNGCVTARYYVDVFPTLAGGALSARAAGPRIAPPRACPHTSIGGVPEIQPLAAAQTGLPLTPSARRLARAGKSLGIAAPGRGCATAITPPRTSLARRGFAATGGRLVIRGRSAASGCRPRRGRLARVTLTIYQRVGPRAAALCRFLEPDGTLGEARPCAVPILLLARGGSSWVLRLNAHLPRGTYALAARAVDTFGALERPGRRASSGAVRAS